MNKFTVNKLGFVDFWFYDLQEFDLSESGCLLLRGSNGSGKSVTMQSFIPLILDGNKTPSRIDPSGTNDKRIENYMLDEQRNERTSYLYMEFKNNNTYTTIGMGLKAERNKSLDCWYFILNDGRRINIDLFLYEGTTEKIALTKKKLENKLPSGFFTTKQHEYMKKVNELIFGYADQENYEDLLNLLIQVRAPKISKDFKPQLLYEILKNSLKVLNDEDLKPVADSMQNMDDLQRRQKLVGIALKSAKFIQSRYDTFNKKILVSKAEKFLEALAQWKTANNVYRQLEALLEQKETALNTAEETKLSQKIEYDVALAKLEEYRETEVGKLRMVIGLHKEKVEALQKKVQEADSNIAKQTSLARKCESKIKDLAQAIAGNHHKTEQLFVAACQYAADSAFPHWKDVDVAKLTQMQQDNSIAFYPHAAADYEARLKKGLIAIEEREALQQTIDKHVEELAAKTDDLRILENRLTDASRLLADRRESYKISFDTWMEGNRVLLLNKEERLSIFQMMMDIQQSSAFIALTEQLHRHYANIHQAIQREILTLQSKEKAIAEKIEYTAAEIAALENTPEAEPSRSSEAELFRLALTQEGIAYTPFYKAFDFSADTENETKNALESALHDMGLLDAICIHAQDRERVMALLQQSAYSDKIIFSDVEKLPKELPVASRTLLHQLFQQQQAIAFLNPDGTYRHGLTEGKGSIHYQAKFIGENNRRLYRLSQIQALQEALVLYQQEQNDMVQKINQLLTKAQQLETEKDSAPPYTPIKEVIDSIDRLILQKSSLEKERAVTENLLHAVNVQYEKARAYISTICKDIPLEKQSPLYKEALENIRRFKEQFLEIKLHLAQIINDRQYQASEQENWDNIESILDNIRYDKGECQREIQTLLGKIAEKEEALAGKEQDGLQERIETCTQIVSAYDGQKERIVAAIATLQTEIKGIQEKITDQTKQLTYEERIANTHREILEKEAARELVLPVAEQEAESFCTHVIATYKKDCPLTKLHYYEMLLQAVNEHSANLRENNVHFVGKYDNSDSSDSFGFSGQSSLLCHIDGKEVSFMALCPALKAEYDEMDLLIKENERQIFEDILLNTISVQIRMKVSMSRLWIEKINRIMSANDTVQRLEFSLRWEGKKAENDDELPVKKIMEILEDDKDVPPEDIEKLSKHFGSKIKSKVREAEDKGDYPNYQSIIREVLDYRQWYEFRLFANKDNKGMKELTLKDFNQLSVGERAMAMYVPLFAAVNARYDSADKKSPRIVCMDEAFAGISDNNKRILFSLLKRMDLEYILNSQELWGTYSEVESLMIYELYREPSDRHVGILKYKWDGKRRVYVE